MPKNSHTLRATHFVFTLAAILAVPNAQAILRVSNPVTGNWNVGGSWVGGTAPGTGDTVEIVAGANITTTSSTSILGVVVDAGGTLTISSTLTMNHGANPTADVVVDGTINVIGGGGSFALASTANCVVRTGGFIRNNSSGTASIWGSGVSPANLTFQSGATYAHDKAGGNTIAPATWNAGSTNLLDYIASGTTVPTVPAGSVFANMTINIPSGTSAQNMAGNLTSIAGHLVVLNTGGAGNDFRLCANTSPTITIGGNVQVLGGTLNLVSGTGIPIITINGVINVSAPGWLRSSGGGLPVLTVNGNSGKLVAASGGTNTFSADWANPPGAPLADAITLDNGVYGADGADFTLNANRGITLNAAGGYLYTTSGRTLTIPGNITGPGGLTKIYPSGTTVNMTFSGVNDFAGDFVITGGGVRFNSSTAAGKGKVIVTMPAGGTANTTLRNTGVPTSTLTNDVVFNANGSLLISLDSDVANTFIMSGKFSGVGAVRHGVNSGGTVVLSGDNSAWSGGLTQQRGTTVLGHKNALGTGTLTIAPSTINSAMPVSLQASTPLTGLNAVANPVVFALPGPNTNWTVSGSNPLELSGPMTLGITAGTTQIITNNNSAGTIFSGAISGPPGLGLTIRGTGTLTLAGNNTYSGPTVLSSGALTVDSSSSVGTGSLTASGGTLTLSGTGNMASSADLNLNGVVTANLNYAGTMTINALFFNGVQQPYGTWGAPGSGALFTDSRFTGTGILNVTTGPATIVLTCSSNITVAATSAAGAVVNFTSSATGNCPPINVNCVPPSGSTFPVGTTFVTCTATDGCGGTTNCSFQVTVTSDPAGKEYFAKDNSLPPTNTVYISPDDWHVLFAMGIVIKDASHDAFTASHPPPGLGTTIFHAFSSGVGFDISTDNGATYTHVTATANAQVQVTHAFDAGGIEHYDNEMLGMDFTVPTGLGPVMLRESPTLQSTGKTTIRAVAGGNLIASFFDVWFECSTDGGVTWQPASGPAHVEMRNNPNTAPEVAEPTPLLPPPQDKYVSPEQWHALYAMGIVIKDVSHDFFTQGITPPAGTNDTPESFNSRVDLKISTDGGATYQDVSATAPVNVSVKRTGSPSSGRYDTEMTGLSLNGLPGGLMLRESPSLPSRGGTKIDQQADGTYKIHSFFDIFPEISTDGGATWNGATNGAVRMHLSKRTPEVPKPTPNLPPPDGNYVSPADWHAFYAMGIVISNASHDRFLNTQPPPPPGGNNLETFGSEVKGQISMDGGVTFQPFTAPANVAINVSSTTLDNGSTRFFNTEMLQLDISGGSLPPGVMIRESPSKASLGRTSIRTAGPSDFRIESFFDIFTEVSMDGGVSWSPQTNKPVQMFLTTNAPASTLTITCPPNITVQATSPAGATVFYTVSTSGGCPPVSLSVNPPSGSTFPVGTTTVTAIATDGCGGNAQCSFTVTVRPQDYFFPQPLLPPPGSVYISPALWHVLYNNGIIIRDVRHRFFTQNYPLPPLGASQLEVFSSELDFEVSMDNGATFSPATGTANVAIQVTHSSDDSSGSHFDTEMLQLDLTTAAFKLRESPTLASTGKTTVRTVPGGYMIDSFFDVFTEISLDNGATWTPAQGPGHVECRPDPDTVAPVDHPTDLLPPPNGAYVSPQQWHALYAMGIVIKDVSHKFFTDSHNPPTPGNTDTHPFGSILDLSVSTDGGATFQNVRTNCDVTVAVTGQGSGASGFYDTEMAQLDATFQTGGMTLKIRESPTLPSRGGTQIDQMPDGSFRIGSFFDIFTEISLDGGATWSGATNGPVRMQLTPVSPEVPKPNPNLPPLDGSYISPAKWHALYANGIIITNASHDRFLQTYPPPPPGGSQLENFGSRVQGLISMNGGATFQPFSAPANVVVQVTSSQDSGPTRFFNTEMLALSLQGGTLPGGVMVRESPSKASLGRTSIRQGPQPLPWKINSFFDVFTEVSLDGGATWSPSITAPGTMGLNTNPPASTLAITCPPDITVSADTAAGAVVTFTVTTSGGCPPINLIVNPPSGSTFPIGTTTVTATATDACGGNVQCQFHVTVKPLPPEYFFPQPVLPPINSVYISPALYHLLFNNGIVIRDVRHRFFTQNYPLPPLGGSQVETFSSEVDFDLSMDNGATFTPATGTANVTVQVTHSHDAGPTMVFDTEMLSLDLVSGPIHLRESPTLQSIGKTTVRQVPGGYLISSFFDVNTEVSTDGGVSWTPAQQPGHVECHPDPKQVTPAPEPTPILPPPNGSYISPQLWHALYAQGIVIRDVRHKLFTGSLPPPPPGATNIHTFNSQLDMQLSTDGGATYQYVRVAAPVQVSVANVGSGNSGFYDTEMLSLSLSGLPAGVMIRESPSLPSRGQTEITLQADGSYRIGSFFDIFTELSLDGGATWSAATNGPVRVELTPSSLEVPEPNTNIPPLDGNYVSPAQWHALYANGIIITNASHDRFTQTQPPPPPGGSQTENFGSRVRGLISMNGGASFQPFSANAGVQVQVTSSLDVGPTRFFNTEMLSLQLSGGTLPGGVMVRESPSKASLGRTSVRTTASGYMIDSFFDVFTELSLDGGATWSPGVTHPGTMGLTTNPPIAGIILTCSTNITVPASSAGGAVVTYSSSASGGCPPVTVNCLPLSGSTFPVGTTTVTCTASDACGQTTNCSFQVTVVPDYFNPTNNLPPSNTVYVSPAVWHALYANGVVIRDIRHRFFTQSLPPPVLGTPQIHSFNSQLDFELSTDNGATFQPVTANANVTVQVTHTLDGPSASFFDTEMTSLDSVFGPVRVRESPSKQSLGKTAIQPVTGGYMISSFFDIFTEVSLDGGATWTPAAGAAHVEMRNDPRAIPPSTEPSPLLPPPDGAYVSPEKWHALYAQGIIITNASHKFFTQSLPPPPPGGSNTHSFNSVIDMQLSLDGGVTFQFVRASAPVQVSVSSLGSGNSGMFDTEMLSLNLTGLPGGIMVRESPTRHSRGATQIDPQPDGTFRIGSFFDIFTEVSIDGGQTWSPTGPVRVQLTTPSIEVPASTPTLPITNAPYISPAQWHAAYANGIYISNVTHRGFTQGYPPPPPGGSQPETFGSTVDGLISMDGGHTFTPFSATADSTVLVSSSVDNGPTRYFNTEMLSLNVTGLPGGVMVRESPSKASLGRTSVRTTASDYRINSFFDIFTEVSTDGGATWTPSTTAPGTMTPRLTPRKRRFPLPNLPPTNSQYISPRQWHALYANGIVISNVTHKRFLANLPPPPPRTTNTHNFGSLVTFLIKMPGQQQYTPMTANADCQVSVGNSGFQGKEQVFQTEMLSLNLSGGTLPPGVMIRESPTRRSTGETRFQGGGGGGGGSRIGSFFDIFTEVSLDGGQTWSPSDSAGYMELHIDPGVPPTTVVNPRVVAGVPTFTVQSQIGLRYLLQYKNGLTDATWTTTTITSGTGAQLDLIDCCPPPGPSRPHRFYRVEIQEDDSQ